MYDEQATKLLCEKLGIYYCENPDESPAYPYGFRSSVHFDDMDTIEFLPSRYPRQAEYLAELTA